MFKDADDRRTCEQSYQETVDNYREYYGIDLEAVEGEGEADKPVESDEEPF